MARKREYLSQSRGFTLIETAIVLSISALMLVGGLTVAQSWLSQATIAKQEQRLAEIKEAFDNYQKQYNRLPCPASLTAAPGTAGFGRERSILPCSVGAGTFAAAGRTGPAAPVGTTPMPTTNPAIIIGTLPVRDLSLPDSYITNSSGYRYTYAVTLSQTATLNGYGGVINIVDAGSNSVTPPAPAGGPAGTALYVVIDHGKDRKGAYSANGAAPAVACGGAAQGLDFENCNSYASGRFRSMPFSTNVGANWFDDQIIYDAGTTTASTPICLQPIYSNRTGTTVPQTVLAGSGSSGGWMMTGVDVGWGWSVINVGPFAFSYINTFWFGPTPHAGFNTVSRTAVAYCPDMTYHAVAGGCSQTNGANATFTGGVVGNVARGTLTNGYGRDLSTLVNTPNTRFGTLELNEQIVFPAQSHPALPNNIGAMGWECNGSSVSGIRPQAYVVCCTGGG